MNRYSADLTILFIQAPYFTIELKNEIKNKDIKVRIRKC